MEVLGIVLLTLALSLLATLYPAWKAASTDPVTVLRYE
jgi:lipoprotein-releasing system permease protein